VSSGLVLLDKPAGITSHDLVAKLRKSMGTKKVGHAGTLDPMATGLMILGVNQGTKLMQFLSGLNKTYQATIKLGESTSTDDAEGEVISRAYASGITETQLEPELEKLRGEITQVPSSVSAISVGGKRAYQLVREGQEVVLPARKVFIERLELTGKVQVTALLEPTSGLSLAI
jgi:tRNA pseudouridine55 synthase